MQFIDSAKLMASSFSILSIIFLKEFKELNINTDTIIKTVELAEFNIIIATVFLTTQTLKMI